MSSSDLYILNIQANTLDVKENIFKMSTFYVVKLLSYFLLLVFFFPFFPVCVCVRERQGQRWRQTVEKEESHAFQAVLELIM